ncbi:MAG TPA: hypothetical protein VLT91_07695, partial [Rhizomicrobium sp.]|nr:hypothetical protein [Rhizomicrobium sp.]
YMNLHVLGASYPLAMGAQAIVTLLSGATVFWAFRHRASADPLVLQALFFACAAAATPYLMCYDAMPLGYAAVALLAADKLDQDGRRLAQLCYWLAFIQMALGMFHTPGAALIPIAFAIYLVRRLRGVNAPGRLEAAPA